MKLARLLVVVVMIGVACTGGSPTASDQKIPSSAQTAEPSPQAKSAPNAPPSDARIYSAVIRQLLLERRQTRSAAVYIVNGAIAGAGKPRGDPFGPSDQPFRTDVIDGIFELLDADLSSFRFITDGNDILRRDGAVKGGGILISLGQIEPKSTRRVLVPNTFWCGGKCSQWQTYVVSSKNGRWTVTGVSGGVVVS